MDETKPKTLVYLVDDDFSVRDSLSMLIESTGQDVRCFESADDFLNNFDPDQAGCLILDVRMPNMTGLELQEQLVRRDFAIPIIFISGHADVPDSSKAFRAGAIDYMEKPFDSEVLLKRMQEAIQKDLDTRVYQAEKRKLKKRLSLLTPRENEVLVLIVKGLSNKEAAKQLDVSNRTVDVHRAKIMEKMEAQDLAELTVMAMHCELI
ncbi:nodulation protein W [Methyloglobulus morosus KoM1]|uniref:Nodulation protein W n=1 Tax=Methyloglobulus morosus KoM1 TaxID=1116472 RepID=V5BX34_9GAMM|nr:response regulator [Methyloglobulus morosus]ESS70807.1 nodulation protein W [Methyloglobulus morosus KoM1]